MNPGTKSTTEGETEETQIITKTSDPINILEPIPIMRILFLAMVKKYPNTTGYNLLSLLSDLSDGMIQLKSGSIYSVLRTLENFELLSSIQESHGRKRRNYAITNKGNEELKRMIHQIKLRKKYLLDLIISAGE